MLLIIRNVESPLSQVMLQNKNYVDTFTFFHLNKTLRVPEDSSQLFLLQIRKNKIVAMDNSGNPMMVLPESGSAADVMIEFFKTKPTGAGSLLGLMILQYLNSLKYY